MNAREIYKRSLDRALRAAELRSIGLTYKEIGRQMGGVTAETARQAVLKGRRIMSRRGLPDFLTEEYEMGNWVLHIEGTGCHHNGKEEIDADLLAPKLVEQLQAQGQTVEHATFTAGGRQNVMVGKQEKAA